jgi:rsbT antagonist protein RsbS
MPDMNIEDVESHHVIAFNLIDDCLITSLQIEVDERYIIMLGKNILNELHKGVRKALLLDATQMELIDITDFNKLRDIIDQVKLMGVRTIVVGLNSGVAVSLVELNAKVDGLVTTLDLETALKIANNNEHNG